MSATRADVLVVGGGIMGLSIAYELTRRNAGRVIVLEKSSNVAQGSTGASSACLRVRYSHIEMIQLALHGMRAYQNWPAYTGLEEPRARMQRTGVLWMMGEDRGSVVAQRDRIRAQGAGAEALSSSEVIDRWPALSCCGVPLDVDSDTEHVCDTREVFLFEEEGGYCTDPVGACQDLLAVCRRDGVDLRFNAAVVAVRTTAGRVLGVTLKDGERIDCPQIVNAAGPWCNLVNAMAGVEHSWCFRPSRVQVMLRAAVETAHGLPMVGDAAGGVYFRPDSSGHQILVGSIRQEDEQELVKDPDALDNRLDQAHKQRLLHALHHRIPGLAHHGRITGVAGMYTMNDADVHPVVGPCSLEGFFLANGFSGHGFKLAPAIGSMLAQLMTGTTIHGDARVDPDFLSIHRSALAVSEKNVLA